MVLVLLVVAFFAFVSRIVLVRAFGLGVLVFGPFSCLFCCLFAAPWLLFFFRSPVHRIVRAVGTPL